MKEIAVDSRTLDPWADVAGILMNATSLSVVAGGKKYAGKVKIQQDEDGAVTLDFGGKKK